MQNRRPPIYRNRIWLVLSLTASSSALPGCFLIPTVEGTAPAVTCDADGGCDMAALPPSGACIHHSDCAISKVCTFEESNHNHYTCLSDPSRLIFVDTNACNKDLTDGSFSNPFCNISDAMPKVKNNGFIRVLSSGMNESIDSSAFEGKSITIIGQYEPRIAQNPIQFSAQQTLKSQYTIRIHHPNTSLTLDGFIISSSASSDGAVECSNDASIRIMRSVIINSTNWGINAKGCHEAYIERNHIINNAGAIQISNTPRYSIVNNIIKSNAPSSAVSSIRIAGGDGLIIFNTIINNLSTGSTGKPIEGAIQVESNPSQIEVWGSIIYQNSMPLTASAQLFPVSQFKLLGVVVDERPQQTFGVDVRSINPSFMDEMNLDYRLVNDKASNGNNQRCCIGQFSQSHNIDIDLFGQARTTATEPGAISGAWNR